MAATKSPIISIRLSAGTAGFVAEMDKSAAKVVEFGAKVKSAHGGAVSNVQATSAALRVMEGSWTNNLRASERFIANVAGLGPILQKAFPIVGGLAFAGLLAKLGEELTDFIKKVQETPRAISSAFRSIDEPLRLANDQLRLSIDKTTNEINKMLGKRQNTLAIQLDESRIAADKLYDSVDKTLGKVEELFKAEGIGRVNAFFTGRESTHDDEENNKRLRDNMAAIESDRINSVDAIEKKRDAGANLASVQKATQLVNEAAAKRTLDLLDQEINKTSVLLDQTKKRQALNANPAPGETRVGRGGAEFQAAPEASPNLTANIKVYTEYRQTLRDLRNNIHLDQEDANAKGKKSDLDAARDQAEYAKVVPEFLRKLDQMILASRAKGTAAALGLGKFWEISAKGYGAAAEAIERENKRLESIRPLAGPDQLPVADKARIIAREQTLALVDAQTQWKTKLQETLVELRAQTAEQDALSAAIGRGYEATTRAAVAAQVIKDTAKEGALVKSDERNALTGAADLAIRSKQNTEALKTIDALRTQIDGERALAAAQLNGAAAARDAALAHKLQQVALDAVGKYVKTLTNTYMELDKAERLNITNQALFKVDERISAINRLSAAVLQGAEAERRAALESKYAAMLASGGDTGENRELIRRTREEDILSRRLDITKAAVRPGSEVSDRLRELDAEYAVLRQIQAEGKGTLETEIALRKVRQEELETLVKYQLQIGTASSGIRAFFIEMQEEGKLAGQVIYDAFKKVTDGISDTLSKILTGQIEKTKGDKHPYERAFGELFKSVGGDVVKDSVTNSIHQGLGALGKLFPSISGITNRLSRTKADGSEASPFWVRLWGGQAPIPSPRSAGRPTIPGTDIPGIPGSGIPTLPPYAGTAAATAATLATGGTPPFLGGSPGVPRSAGRAGVGTAGTWGSILSRILLGAGVGTRTGAGGARIGDLDRTVATEPGGTLGPGLPPPSGPGSLPTGTDSNPLYIKPASSSGIGGPSITNVPIPQGPGTASNVFSALGTIVGAAASAFGPSRGGGGDGRASGGPISADSAYLVGEYGPEILSGASGYIRDASSTKSLLTSSTGDRHYYNIDARGTDPALVGMHVQRAIEESQHTSVATSVRAVHDRTRRTVRSSRG